MLSAPLRRLFLPLRPALSCVLSSSSSPFKPPFSSSELESLVLQQYHHGKFNGLVATAVSHPSVLSAACLSLASRADSLDAPISIDHVSLRRFIEQLSRDLRANVFDPHSHSIKLLPSRKKGECLTLPNLNLKVVIESVRMILDVVYERRFATFAYGGRVGLGRHTAVRYLKSSVENPTWWFRVSLRRQQFHKSHMGRLVSVLAEKIDDPALFGLVESMFESGTVNFELGGLDLGRGFPQESGLVPILVNIYFDGLDRMIQEIRAEVHKKNPRLESIEREGNPRIFHNPIRVYAVRYLDELLVITSGSKMFTMNVKDKILKYLEGELELKVDKLETSIHSAVSEKMNFMGMELQAVPPSVLYPPLSEKAKRARKKYLNMKAARAQELKNARETVRKKLGMRILSHVFKKLRRCEGFKFDFRIESEVREIFKNWGEEVVAEFFKLREECWSWHRMLTSGDFLSLKRVRDQLPAELVDAYDEFHEKADKYLMPVKPSKIIEEEKMQEEEEEERKYAKRTVEDLTELRMKVNAPMEIVRRAVKLAGFTNSMGRPRPIKLLICLDDVDIIKWYAGVGRRWLEFFCCCRNFKMVKTVVNYHLRFSCLLTLAEKHEATKRETIRHYTKDLKVSDGGVEGVHFPTEREIRMMGDENLSDPMPVDGALCLIPVRLACNEPSGPCSAYFCGRKDTILYRIRLLQNRLNVDPLNEKKWVPGMGAIHEGLNKKCFSLCSKHASHLFLGRISLQNIDCTAFTHVE